MTQFDMLLRQGLMDANLEQYGRVLRSVEAKEPDFSPRYLRERMRLLSAPQEWERRQTRPAPRRRKIPRGIAVAIAVLLLITAAAAAAVSLWVTYFGGLDQRQQEIVGDMELSGEKTGKPETTKTTAESLLPPPVEHDGVTITPLRLLGAKNKLYLALEIRTPEETVFSPEDGYHLFDKVQVPQERRTEMIGFSGGFTVLVEVPPGGGRPLAQGLHGPADEGREHRGSGPGPADHGGHGHGLHGGGGLRQAR